MRGNRDPEFLDRINGVFICFVVTAIRHCLKAWKTWECDNGGPDFKYETAWCKESKGTCGCEPTEYVGMGLT